jgi:hypothetical protein
MFLKTHFTIFIDLDVLRVTDFPEFPNTVLGVRGCHLLRAELLLLERVIGEADHVAE